MKSKQAGEQEGNKLIDDWYYADHPGLRAHYITEGKPNPYHESWTQIMPVIEKIWKMGKMVSLNFYTEGGGTVNCKIYNWDIGDPYQDAEDKEPIIALWKAVIQFIQWYNSLPVNNKTKKALKDYFQTMKNSNSSRHFAAICELQDTGEQDWKESFQRWYLDPQKHWQNNGSNPQYVPYQIIQKWIETNIANIREDTGEQSAALAETRESLSELIRTLSRVRNGATMSSTDNDRLDRAMKTLAKYAEPNQSKIVRSDTGEEKSQDELWEHILSEMGIFEECKGLIEDFKKDYIIKHKPS